MDGKNKFVSPFYRPWMTTYGAAAPAGGSNKGMKGIVAGIVLFLCYFLYDFYHVISCVSGSFFIQSTYLLSGIYCFSDLNIKLFKR